MKIDPKTNWMQDGYPARHWTRSGNGDGHVICKLTPRNCRIPEGHTGHCGVRGNIGGELFTFNYGKSVEATLEFIETEAVYHYRPGAKILSLGNIGCMLSCDFCQNWRTSQVRHLDDREVRHYSPHEIVETCKNTGIDVISWTYNDPVVWHEFVVETSRLAQANGIATLYKSAFYIEPAAVEELLDCIDIFSISLKSMSERFYRKFTGGAHLQPVLDMIKLVHRAGNHLEISQLIVTGRNDSAEEISTTNSWMLENLGDSIPLHYVGFHPAYLYTNTTRTRPEVLRMAREMALSAGIKHCYVGNMFEEGIADTYCTGCGAVTVARFGLQAEIVGLEMDGRCARCGMPGSIQDPFGGTAQKPEAADVVLADDPLEFFWHEEAQSVHIEIENGDGSACPLHIERMGVTPSRSQDYVLGGILRRIIVSKQTDGETGIRVRAPEGTGVAFFPVLDRAHFPTSTNIGVELAGYQRVSAGREGGKSQC